MGLLAPVVATLLADTKEYSAKMDQSIAKMEKFGATGATTGDKIAGVWNKISTVTLAGAAVVAGAALDLAYKYGESLDMMQRTTHLTGAQMDYLKGKILNVSTATATAAPIITGGLTQLIKSGEGSKQALIDVATAAQYAKATGGDLNATLTSAIGIQKTHITGTKNITQTLNIMDTAIKNSQLSANDLNSALGGRALSAFAAYHIDLKSSVAVLAGFADQNLRGSRSVLILKTGLAALEKPATDSKGHLTAQAKAVAAVHLNMTTLAAEIRKPGGMLAVMGQLSTAFNTNASAAMKAQGIGAWLQQIFGTSAGPAFTNIIAELPKLMNLYDKMNNSGGAVKGSFNEWLTSPAGAVAKFKTVLQNTAIRLGNVLLPKLTVGLIEATRLITSVMGSPTGSSLVVGGVEALIGGAIATKIVRALLGAASGLGVKSLAGAGAAELGATAAGAGAITAAGIAAFIGTTDILKHNLFGLGTAVNKLTSLIMGDTHNSTTSLAGTTAKLVKRAGINESNATVGLGEGTMRWLQAGSPKYMTHKASTKTGVKVTVTH